LITRLSSFGFQHLHGVGTQKNDSTVHFNLYVAHWKQ